MAAVTFKSEAPPGNFEEKVLVTVAATGDTYVSRKLSTVVGGTATVIDTTAVAVALSFSGKVVTITAAVTNKDVSLSLWGYH